MAGDVEVNPGPVTRICPMCLASVHIRKLQCECGHIFLLKKGQLSQVHVNGPLSQVIQLL